MMCAVTGDAAAGYRDFRAPFILDPGVGLHEQYGYAPLYTRHVPAFDSGNRAYIRSRTSNGAYTSYLHSFRDGSWVQLDFLASLRAAYPTFTGTVGASGLRSDRIVFDRQDRAYNPLTIRLGDGTLRNVLMVSWDRCRTWKVFELPAGEIAVEHWVGHNEIDGPPFLAIWREWKPSLAANGQRNSLWVTKPRLDGETLIIPTPTLVTRECIGLHKDSGGSSFAVTHGSSTAFTWAEATTVDKPATPQYVATYDHVSGVVSPRVFLARAKPANDTHNKPGLCVDSSGYLHFAAGTHGSAVLYRRSLEPYSVAGGWTAAVPVLTSGYVTNDALPSLQEGQQTYNAMVCDSSDTLHLVTRQWRRGVDEHHEGASYGALIHQSRPRDGEWSEPTVVTVAAEAGYSVFFHKLGLDHQDRLFLSCSYSGGTERERHFARSTTLERLGRSEEQWGKYRRRMLLVSDDGGAAWRFAEDTDFALPGEAVPAEPPVQGVAGQPGEQPFGVQWSWLRPKPQGNQFTALDFVSSRVGWAVGTHGTIMRSVDGGVTWGRQWSGTLNDIHAVAAIDAQTAWAVGQDGLILKTVNAGRTWRSQASLTTRTFYAITAHSSNAACAVGHRGVVRLTSDGGKTWRRGYSKTVRPLFSTTFVTRSKGWACGGTGRILVTSDGGRTWRQQHSKVNSSLHAISFFDETRGLALGQGVALFTRDGGRVWQRSPVRNAPNVRAAHMVTGRVAYAAGAAGCFLKSNDGGRNWTKRTVSLAGMCGALDATANGIVWAGGVGGQVVRSRDWGRTWSQAKAEATASFRDAERVENSMWVVAGKGIVAESPDGGLTWRRRPTPISTGLSAISLNGHDGYAVGEGGVVLKSQDGGASWSQVASPTTFGLSSVVASAIGDVWIAGDKGVLASTADGGGTWFERAVTQEDLVCLHFLGDAGWAGGGRANGETLASVIRTTDHGQTWKETRLPVWGRVQDLCFLDRAQGWAAAVDWGPDGDLRGGAILTTGDGGATWSVQARVPTALTAVRMTDHLNGWAVGESGTALRTWDGGRSWIQLEVGTDSSLYDVSPDSAGNQLAVGQGGAVLYGMKVSADPD